MEPSLIFMIDILKIFGVPGLLIVFWYFDRREVQKLMDQNKNDIQTILGQYQKDMQEQRRMYENNAELVRITQSISQDLKEIVILNTQKWAEANKEIQQNQYRLNLLLGKTAGIEGSK